jgi:hypothetical protein
MKFRIVLLLFAMLTVFGCEKTEYKNTGTIIGADMTLCACCGGYFIDIEGTQYRFQKEELPGNFNFNDNQLPLSVELNWERKTETCVDFRWIAISEIRNK